MVFINSSARKRICEKQLFTLALLRIQVDIIKLFSESINTIILIVNLESIFRLQTVESLLKQDDQTKSR